MITAIRYRVYRLAKAAYLGLGFVATATNPVK